MLVDSSSSSCSSISENYLLDVLSVPLKMFLLEISPMDIAPLDEDISVSLGSSSSINDYETPGIALTWSCIFLRKAVMNDLRVDWSPYRPFKVILRQHLTSFMVIWSLTADMSDWRTSESVSSIWGLTKQLRSILRMLKDSLLTAVAIHCSISIISKLVALLTYENISNILFEVKAKGTFTFIVGS